MAQFFVSLGLHDDLNKVMGSFPLAYGKFFLFCDFFRKWIERTLFFASAYL